MHMARMSPVPAGASRSTSELIQARCSPRPPSGARSRLRVVTARRSPCTYLSAVPARRPCACAQSRLLHLHLHAVPVPRLHLPAVPAQPRGVFWSAASGEGWNVLSRPSRAGLVRLATAVAAAAAATAAAAAAAAATAGAVSAGRRRGHRLAGQRQDTETRHNSCILAAYGGRAPVPSTVGHGSPSAARAQLERTPSARSASVRPPRAHKLLSPTSPFEPVM